MSKMRLRLAGFCCLLLPLLVSCSTTPSPNNANSPPVVKASVVSSANSSPVATHKSTSSTQSTSSKSASPVNARPNQQASVVKPVAVISSTSSAQYSSHSSSSSVLPQKESNLLEATSVDTRRTSISGSVSLLGKNGETLPPEGVIINLEPIAPLGADTTSGQPAQYHIDMRNKAYSPKLLTVKQNDVVFFSNKDKIKHNTFSSSGENTFDLGTFGSGITQNAKLVAPGIVKVYCNIHPEMATFISVSAHNYSFITQADGKFVIKDLPPGRYTLSAWHIRGEVQQSVDLTKDSLSNLVVTIDTSTFVPVPHKNKYGENYKVKPALFNDEFY